MDVLVDVVVVPPPSELSNVLVETLQDKDILVYDGPATVWRSQPIRPSVTVSTDYVATQFDWLIRMEATTADLTVTLPPVADSANLVLVVKKVDLLGYKIIIDGDGSDLIDGRLTQTLSLYGESITLQCDGASWAVLSHTVPRTIGITVDGGGSPVTTGFKGFTQVPFGGTICRWTMFADVAGSVVFDVWKDVFANYPPDVADSIAGTGKPTLSSAITGESSDLSLWSSVAVEPGDIVGFNVDSASTLTRVTLLVWIIPS